MHDVVELIPVDESVIGGNIKRKPRYDDARTVYARAMSVGEREFYDSAQAGFRLDVKFELWEWDYQGERRVHYGGREYDVVRQYSNDKSHTMELSCERVEGRQDG
jgi:head-tail adaptor